VTIPTNFSPQSIEHLLDKSFSLAPFLAAYRDASLRSEGSQSIDWLVDYCFSFCFALAEDNDNCIANVYNCVAKRAIKTARRNSMLIFTFYPWTDVLKGHKNLSPHTGEPRRRRRGMKT
jgi:hypothetical protein